MPSEVAQAVREGRVDEALVDRAVLRVLRQKLELGLLDATFEEDPPTGVDLDSPHHRAIARKRQEECVGRMLQVAPLHERVRNPLSAALGGARGAVEHLEEAHEPRARPAAR